MQSPVTGKLRFRFRIACKWVKLGIRIIGTIYDDCPDGTRSVADSNGECHSRSLSFALSM